MQYVFVDTNFFMHYKNYRELDWNLLFAGSIHIIITYQVITELDNHKNNENARKRDRAKAAIPLLRSLIDGPVHATVKRKDIIISIIDPLETATPRKPFIDLSKPDDRIANEVMAWSENHRDDLYCVLTGDIGLMMTCKNCDISCKELPEGWKRPPAPDEKERKIAALEKQVAHLSNNKPNLILYGNDIYSITIKQFSKPSEEYISDIISELCSKIVRREDFSTEMENPVEDSNLSKIFISSPITRKMINSSTLVIPTQSDIKNYHQQYNLWKEKFKSTIASSNDVIKNSIVTLDVGFKLANEGSAPAEDVRINIKAVGGILILPENDDSENSPWADASSSGRESLDFPPPPIPPKKRYVDSHTTVLPHHMGLGRVVSALHHSLSLPPVREIDEFYWETTSPKGPQAEWTLLCNEFRHQLPPASFNLTLMVPESGLSGEVKLEISVYSRQLPNPIFKTIGITHHIVQGDISERINEEIFSYINAHQKE